MQKGAEIVRLKSQNSQFILYVNCNSFDEAVKFIDEDFSNKKELKNGGIKLWKKYSCL